MTILKLIKREIEGLIDNPVNQDQLIIEICQDILDVVNDMIDRGGNKTDNTQLIIKYNR